MYNHTRFISVRLLLAALLLLAPCTSLFAIDIPKEHVFYFERSTNENYVCYDINLKDGALCQKEPLKAYWVLGGGKRIEGLTFLDRKMAFGIKVIKSTKDEASVYMTANKDLSIRICKRKGKWVGIIKVNGREIVLQKMFAQMKPPFSVKCEYIDIFGTDPLTGEKLCERLLP